MNYHIHYLQYMQNPGKVKQNAENSQFRPCSPRVDHLLDDPQEGHAIPRRLLLADAGDVQEFVYAQRLALDHLPEGGVAEHHISRDILLCSETLAQSVERRQKLFVGLTEVGVGGSTAGRRAATKFVTPPARL